MSLADDFNNSSYTPVFLFEFDADSNATFATNIASFVWYVNFLNLYSWIDTAFLDTGWEVPYITRIGSIKTDEGFYVNAGSADACIATPGSFYFDVTTKGLWVRRYDGNNPMEYPFVYGVVFGLRKGGNKQYYDDVEYPPWLLSVPSITVEKSDYYTGKVANRGATIKTANADDQITKIAKEESILGNPCRMLAGCEHYNYESFELTFTGYIRAITPDLQDATFDVKQANDKMDIPLPVNRYNQSKYAYLSDDFIDKYMPLIYGKVPDVPAICLNDTETTPLYYTFKVADTADHEIHAISAAYKYVDDIRETLSIVSTDLVNGTFTVLAADYDPGQKVTADVEGFEDSGGTLIENALDVIKDLIVTYGHAQDSAVYFNNTYWDDADAFDIGYVIEKESSIEKAIEEITQKGTLAHFQQDDDGRYSCRIFDSAAAVDKELVDADIISVTAPTYTVEKLIAELVINYNRRVGANIPEVVTNTDYKAAANWLYETFTRKEIDTIISGAADAVSFGEAYQAWFGVPWMTLEIETNLMLIDQRISNILQIPFHRPKSVELGLWKCEILGKTVSPDTNKVMTKVRPFAEVEEN
jgi:hypothetical protein